MGENSVWYSGLMSGGVFQGRFWRSGVLTKGKFYGGLSTFSEANQAIKTYDTFFYGLWNDGYVSANEFEFTPEKVAWTKIKNTQQENVNILPQSVDMDRVLWKFGTFSHESGNFNNSIWLDGEFKSGNFNNSQFNRG
jgi:alpha-acetolactate decarboxylase